MFNFLTKLFEPKPPKGTVIITQKPDQCDGEEIITFPFEYSVRISCPSFKGYRRVTIKAPNSHVDVSYRCLCGKVIELLEPPVTTVRMLGDNKFTFISNSMVRLSTGPYGLHQVDKVEVIKTNPPVLE